MSEHALFAPSAAERWMNCPGSFRAEQEAEPRADTRYTKEGTNAHEIFAQALLTRTSPRRFTDDPFIAGPLHEAWLTVMQLIGDRRFLVEQRLEPLPGLPDLWGTSDIIVFDERGHLVMVIDLKFGVVVAVEPDSSQLVIYTLLAAQQFGASPAGVTSIIVQPRAQHAAGPARQHHHTPAALSAFLPKVQTAVTAALQPDAPRVSGLWCRWCAVRETCPTRRHNLPPVVHSPFHQGIPGA